MAVGDEGNIALGDAAASTWARVDDTTPVYNSVFWDVAQGNGRLVVTTNNGIMVSHDGALTWDWVSMPTPLYSVAYSGSAWIAVGNGGAIYTSSDADALVWTSRSSGTNQVLYGVACGGSLCVAVGDSGVIRTSSNNGASWQTSSSSTTDSLRSVAYGGGTWVVGGTTGQTRYSTSPTSTTWIAATTNNDKSVFGLAHNGSMFVGACDSGTIITSSNGTSWSVRGSGSAQLLRDVTWNSVAHEWVALSANRGEVMASADGSNWSLRDITGQDLTSIVFDGTRLVAVGQLAVALTSPTGATWTTRHGFEQNVLTGIAYLASASRWVAIDDNGLFHVSTDRANWTSLDRGYDELRGVACSPTRCVAVGDGAAMWTSDDGITWTGRRADNTVAWETVIWNDSYFLTAGDFGRIATSSDGINWTLRTSNTTQNLYGAAWNGSTWVLVGGGGTLLTSANAATWTAQVSGAGSTILWGVAAHGSSWIVVAQNGNVLTSSNTTSWTANGSGASDAMRRAAWDGDRWVVGGLDGVLRTSTNGTSWSVLTDPALSFSSVQAIARIGNVLAVVGARVSGFVATLAR
ncbi:MAG: hypothetical protein U1F43_32480 [Myxococcota bacterium]